jgi:coenzyme F420-reducing hydrogenase gamma subunit
MDHKYFGQTGKRDVHHLDIPKAMWHLTGGIRNQEHLEVAEAMRKSCDIIIALGTCATHGGIPALINQWVMMNFSTAITRFPRYQTRSHPSDPVLPPVWTGLMPG